ncbi:MAG: hypothetical protein U0Z75_00580 [Deinococcaceae bacterium]
MQKSTLRSLALLALISTTSALADSIGFRAGAPFGLQYTIDNGFGRGKDLRLAAQFNTFFGEAYGQIQADIMLGRKTLGDNRDLSLFYGLGPHVRFVTSNALAMGGQGTLGLEYQIDKRFSVFADTSVGISIWTTKYLGNTMTTYYGGAFGVNYKL